ncbi:16816_t:CDS:1, partial [Cetraspora pellucida]
MSFCKCYYNYNLFKDCCAIKIRQDEDKKININNIQEYLFIALYRTVKTINKEQEFKNIFINKPILDNSNKQIPENLPNELDESNNNEQLFDELDEQLPEEEDQIPDQIEEQEEQQIPDNTFLIENLKKAIKDSKLEDLFLNEQIYKDIVNSLLIFEEKNKLQDE